MSDFKKNHEIPPVTKADKKLAKKHLKERIKFNEGHAKEHEKIAKKATDKKSIRYNRTHAANHRDAADEARKMIKDGKYLRQ